MTGWTVSVRGGPTPGRLTVGACGDERDQVTASILASALANGVGATGHLESANGTKHQFQVLAIDYVRKTATAVMYERRAA
jgi:hypothetical protein